VVELSLVSSLQRTAWLLRTIFAQLTQATPEAKREDKSRV